MITQTLRDAGKYEKIGTAAAAPCDCPAFHLSTRAGGLNDPDGRRFLMYTGVMKEQRAALYQGCRLPAGGKRCGGLHTGRLSVPK